MDLLRKVGLARILSKAGYCSRSDAADLIRSARVTLNGKVRRDPETPVLLGRDRVEVDGRPLAAATKLYLMLNKPRGIVTTTSDEKGRQTVYSLLKEEVSWVVPVGRLDKASEGLLLLTNDTAWAARVLAPESHLDKIYHAQIGTIADNSLIEVLSSGLRMNDGTRLRAKSARILRTGQKNSWIEITLDEGRNRHIRRMFAQLGIEVLRLLRVAIGPLVAHFF